MAKTIHTDSTCSRWTLCSRRKSWESSLWSGPFLVTWNRVKSLENHPEQTEQIFKEHWGYLERLGRASTTWWKPRYGDFVPLWSIGLVFTYRFQLDLLVVTRLPRDGRLKVKCARKSGLYTFKTKKSRPLSFCGKEKMAKRNGWSTGYGNEDERCW